MFLKGNTKCIVQSELFFQTALAKLYIIVGEQRITYLVSYQKNMLWVLIRGDSNEHHQHLFW